MLDRLKRIFGQEPVASNALPTHEPLQLATASLLLELARTDFSESSGEIETIRLVLQKHFGLDANALDTLIAEAGRGADRAVSLHEFTHRLNRELPEADKLAIVEMLWQVSHADGRVDKHEEQLIWRIAGLLHIADRDRLRLKLKVSVER